MKQRMVFILVLLPLAASVRAANPALPVIPSRTFNVTNYGAMGNAAKDNTTNIQNAISAAVTAGGGTVEIPAGTFLSSSFTLYSNIRLQVDAGALLQMLPYGTYYGSTSEFIYCNNVHDLEISGGGTIDGQGTAWWTAYNSNNSLARPLLLQLYSCDRLFIHDVTFQNPPYHTCGLRDNGGNITISNLTVNTPSPSPNTDGLNFVGTNCIIENCHISDGDDNIALGSTGPIQDLLITNCAFGNGHGVSIGSGISSGITNLTVINCSFNGTVNGIRMKCDQGDSEPVANLNYLNLAMTNVSLPIVIYTYYNVTGTPDGITPAEVLAPSNTAPVTATTPRWSNITISNLFVSSAGGDIGGIIWGPTEMPISNFTLVCITNTAPKTFDIYNARGVKIINSQFNFASGNTFTLCNADVTLSNTVAGNRAVTIGGATSSNSLALYNSPALMSSTNLFAANPLTLSGSALTNSSSLTLTASTTQNFFLGTNSSTVTVLGNLTLNSTLNIASADGFTVTNYVLFGYTGSLIGQPTLGGTPAGYEGYSYALNTNTSKEVLLVVSPPSPPNFSNVGIVSSNGNLTVSGTGGVTNGSYYVVVSTNIALPLNQWTRIATNQFDAGGNFTFTNGVDTNAGQQFYFLQVP
ncbi:MAG TPA: glycosyl hydrolase family 28 protein [Verrucomicrobiae bacterium]|nr:glycosyl hydrolase family 28 protein [Verrucomicrobiae bacterium]